MVGKIHYRRLFSKDGSMFWDNQGRLFALSEEERAGCRIGVRHDGKRGKTEILTRSLSDDTKGEPALMSLS